LRATANRQVKGAYSDLPFFEPQQDARTRIPTVESSAAALRPCTPIFATLLLVFFSVIGVDLSSAASPDIRLLPLIPPGSEVVAGIHAPRVEELPSNFLFITKNNRVDLDDFIAITGSDQSRVINEVIFTASSGQNGKPVEHSILVSGHFNQDRIFRVPSANATQRRYRDIDLLDISPFERERSFFKHRRWLVFIGSSTAIFGTEASVQAEIDRSLAGSPPDAAILQRLAHLRRDNDAWSLVPSIGHSAAVLRELRMLDPVLANLAESGDSLAFGIRYGRHVELEFDIELNSRSDTTSLSDPVSQPPAGLGNQESLLLSHPGISGIGDPAVHRVLKLSKAQFEKWIDRASNNVHAVVSSSH